MKLLNKLFNKCSKAKEDRKEADDARSYFYDKLHSHIYHLFSRNDDGTMVLEQSVDDIGELDDGYHSFNQLYEYRMLYNAAFFNLLAKKKGNPYNVYKSTKHSDGEDCFGGGWFIVSAQLPMGQITNHYEMKDWNYFNIPIKEQADEWDGHSPVDVENRLRDYLNP